MSNFNTAQVHEGEIPSSPSSDEKMDTGSESLRSMHTPSSVLSSDYEDGEDQNVLRLQNPQILRLTSSNDQKSNEENLNDSLLTKMSSLKLDSSGTRPKHLGISPPRFSSMLTSTTNHPLMGLGSPDENFPDLIPKKHKEDEKDLSLSSVEDEKTNETNGYNFYSPQRNTSKSNLYFNDNFTTAESHILSNTLDVTSPPDVARGIEKRKITPRFETSKTDSTPQRFFGRMLNENMESVGTKAQSTPKAGIDIPEVEEFHSGVAEWCESPSHLRSMPNFDLPIELKTNVNANDDIESEDEVSSESRSGSRFEALVEPCTGRVALRATPAPRRPARRLVVPPPEDDQSLDEISVNSLESDEEPPPALQPPHSPHSPRARADSRSASDDDTKRSSNTISGCSSPIPEYSAAEELRDERAWLAVPRAGGHATCDMKVIEPYKRVVSHGGYDACGAAVIVFSACHLPDYSRQDYSYVMYNLFLYVIWTLERLVTDEYVLIYLHGSAGKRRLPTFHWLHECYKLIDRRLRKSLKHLYLVHPTFWLKSIVMLTKPFISSKFFRKLSYVRNLTELAARVPVEPNAIPELVKQYDAAHR